MPYEGSVQSFTFAMHCDTPEFDATPAKCKDHAGRRGRVAAPANNIININGCNRRTKSNNILYQEFCRILVQNSAVLQPMDLRPKNAQIGTFVALDNILITIRTSIKTVYTKANLAGGRPTAKG